MSRADEYRKQAAECRQIADQMSLGEYRDQLIKMAESWERMANDAEIGFGQPRSSVDDDSADNEPGQ
jgi:hypothetical protein